MSMKTKRILAFCLMLWLLPALAFADAAPLAESDLWLSLGTETYQLGQPAAPLLAAAEAERLGPLLCEAAPSCMFFGQDKEYTSDSLMLATVPSQPDGGDTLESVMVLCAGLPTARGVEVGMTRAQVEAAYGTDYLFDYDQMNYLLDKDKPEGAYIAFLLDLDTQTVTAYLMIRNVTKEG